MTRDERAQLAWQVLASAAHNRQVITYTMLADAIGMGGPGTLAHLLGSIMYFCQQKGLPPLTVLVVKKDSGRPGLGLTTLENLASDPETLHDWPKYRDELVAMARRWATASDLVRRTAG